MSGMCGWIGLGAAPQENRQLVESMAASLSRFDGAGMRAAAGCDSALAIASNNTGAYVYQGEGLLVGVLGQVAFRNARMIEQAHEEGIARTLASVWRERKEGAVECLSGAFSFCVIDEDNGQALLAIDRMGVHSLAYQVTDGCLVFGSSTDALARHPKVRSEIDPQGLFNYVYFHMVPAPGTI